MQKGHKEVNKEVNEKLRLGRTPAELLFSLFSVPLFPSLREGIGVGILFLLYLLTSNIILANLDAVSCDNLYRSSSLRLSLSNTCYSSCLRESD